MNRSAQKEKVAILGAGPMGLAAAYQLVQQGYPPVIFEADDRIGGMTAACNFNALTIGRDDHLHRVETKMGYWTQGKLQAWGHPLALLKFQGLSLPAKIRYGLHAFASTKRNDWRALDGINA